MVPRAESAELAAATLARPVRDLAGVGPVEAAARLDSLEVVGHTVPPLDRPRGAARQDLVQRPRVERQRAARADARRDRRVERVHQAFHPGGDVGGVNRALHEAHAAVDVEPDRAGADDAVRGVGRHDAADGQAVALVDVRHRERRSDDPGEGGAVGQLLERRVAPDGGDQALVGDDQAGHAHPSLRVARNPPEVRTHLLELHGAGG